MKLTTKKRQKFKYKIGIEGIEQNVELHCIFYARSKTAQKRPKYEFVADLVGNWDQNL